MEYYGNTLCISARELVDEGVMSIPNYKALAARGRLEVVRRGRGAGCYALVSVDTMPERYQAKVRAAHPEMEQERLTGWLMKNYETDQGAVAFYSDAEKTGVELKAEKMWELVRNASVLNECIKLYSNSKATLETMGEHYDWSMMSRAVAGLRDKIGHTLPASMLRFRAKAAAYKRDGYVTLISGKYYNQNRRKVDYRTERLILGIAILPNKPYNKNVWEMYNDFVVGELDVYDPETGELFEPRDFTDRDGAPLELSESTINNYLNKPKNRILIRHALSSWSTYMHEERPHVHRHAPEFSFSKISLDDRDLPRKLTDTKARPKVYYAYDVTSNCIVGAAYSRNKTTDIVIECFRDMFRLIEREGWNCPAQVEVENHLMSQWRDTFLKAGVMFPFVRFCAPLNSQEKTAEALNGAKKRSIEHKNHAGVGRFYAKDYHYRMESRKISDASNDTWEDKDYYTWEELIAEDRADVAEWNAAPHPNQKKYPGMSRWDVLVSCMNPTLQPVNKSVMARYIGEHVQTTVRRNSYCRVAYTDWWLSSPAVIEKLQPNDYTVDAYYLTDAEGEIEEVYIYQRGMLIDKLSDVGTYNTAECEQTEEDKKIYTEQVKKISAWDAYVRARDISAVGVQRAERAEPERGEAAEGPAESEPAEERPWSGESYAERAINQL
jgi:hypothetical protein